MKKILIKAYTEVNLGDDLFIKILCERYPNIKFYLSVPYTSRKPYLKIKNLELITKIRYIDGIFSRLKLPYNINNYILKKYADDIDAIVHVGGSIFIESKNSSRKIQEQLNEIRQFKNYFVLGSNFGPYTTNEFFQEYKKNFSEMRDICFRDEYSFELFKDLKNVRMAPDIVFSLDIDNIDIYINMDRTIVISLIDLSNRKNLKEYKNSYEESIIKICRKLIDNDYNVILMSFCKKEGDEEAAKRIQRAVSSKTVTTYFYKGHIDEALTLINSAHGVIATRFHAMILGWVLKKPTFPYAYSKKMINVLRDINYTHDWIRVENSNIIDAEKVVEFFSDQSNINITSQINQSIKQFQGLDEYINNS